MTLIDKVRRGGDVARSAGARAAGVAQVLLNVPTGGYILRLISPSHHHFTHKSTFLSINPSSSSTTIPARTMADSSSPSFAASRAVASRAAASLHHASSNSAPGEGCSPRFLVVKSL
ncbi:hypothetical protein GGI42DRAFT_128740 [Trichoderma sp. SZMC 28013]